MMTKKFIKYALIFISAFSISSCGIIFKNKSYGQNNIVMPKATNNVFAALTSDGSVYFSADAESWTKSSVSSKAKWNNLVVVNHKLFLVGMNGAISVSNDGQDWTKLPIKDYRLWLYDAVHVKGHYVVVGINGLITVSKNLSDWSINKINTMSWLTSVVTDGNKIVACGSHGEIIYGYDDKKWFEATSPTNSWLSDIEYYNNRFYAVGYDGTIISSTDASNWQDDNSNTSNWLYSIRGFESSVIVVGDKATVLEKPTNSNDNTWKKIANDIPQDLTLRTVVSDDNGNLYVGGQHGYISSSSDVSHWTYHGINTNATVLRIVYLNLDKE